MNGAPDVLCHYRHPDLQVREIGGTRLFAFRGGDAMGKIQGPLHCGAKA